MNILSKLGFKKEGVVTGYRQISSEEAKRLIDEENAKVLDVRSRAEFNEGHIKDAVHISVQEIRRVLEVFKDKDEKIIVYCYSGARSAVACNRLAAEGYTNLYNLKSGIIGWKYGLEK